MNKSKFYTLENVVTSVLVAYPKARDNDGYCYIKVASALLGEDVSNVTLMDALVHRKEFPKT